MVNTTVPKSTNEDNLEVIDFSKTQPFDDLIAKTRDIFREKDGEVELYAIGFSLGANTLLRYLGECGEK